MSKTKLNKPVVFMLLILGLIIFNPFTALAASKTLYPTDDATIKSDNPTLKYGASSSLEIKYIPAGTKESASLIKFNISEIPDNVEITKAQLKLHIKQFNTYDSPQVDINTLVRRNNGDWSESSVTWNNSPPTVTVDSTNTTISPSESVNAWEVTNIVKGWYEADYKNDGFRVMTATQTPSHTITFGSSESSDKPKLYIEYTESGGINLLNPNIFKFLDVSAPEISEIEVKTLSDASAEIAWKTDEDTSGSVEYGKTDGYGKTAGDATETEEHSLWLYGLESETKYHFRIVAEDKAGNETKSSDHTFTTNEPDTIGEEPPIDHSQPPSLDDTSDDSSIDGTPAAGNGVGTGTTEPESITGQDSEEEPDNGASSESMTSKELKGGIDLSEILANTLKVVGVIATLILMIALGYLLSNISKNKHEKENKKEAEEDKEKE
jgi:hypothetical protein